MGSNIMSKDNDGNRILWPVRKDNYMKKYYD